MTYTRNEQQKEAQRRKGFQPGQPSANPGGRPRMAPDLKEAFKSHAPEALATLLDCLRSDSARWADKNRAAEIILNRGYGMPTQAVAVDVNHTMSITAALEAMRAKALETANPPVIEVQAVEVARNKT